ncbi:MAG: alpha-1,2-fucosyltransferase [Spirochaetaceae bacterium]|nr:alpha-1,2-fucosyltransferase [Spirochaetaceae bacterium]
MIIVKIMGGLGNQLFQYAYARALKEAGKNVFLDYTTFLNYDMPNPLVTKREYALDAFNITIPCLTPEYERVLDVLQCRTGNNSKRFLYKIIRKLYWITGQWKLFDSCDCSIFSEKCLDIPDSKYSYVSGYFQSEKYFSHIHNILMEELQLKEGTPETGDDLCNDPRVETVSVHVRRGDYVTAGDSLKTEYYQRAFMHIESKLHNIEYCIFSDDLAYCEANLDLKDRRYRLMNPDRKYADYEELFIMAKCRHHIIANSSFSWWGAWLCRNPNQIVIAPAKWQVGEAILWDIVPSLWIKA